MEIFLGWFVLSCVIGYWAGKRGRSAVGWALLSMFLSPLISALIVAVLPKRGDAALPKDELGNPISPESHVLCPDCRELVKRDARKCKHCGTALVPQ